MDQKRYFVGIALPDSLTSVLMTIQATLHDSWLLEPLVPHITLLHPQLLTSLSPLYLLPKLKPAAEPFLPLHINLDGTDRFDDRVLYLTVSGAQLAELQQSLMSLLPEKIIAQYTGRDFTAHVTLAQAKPRQKIPLETIESLTSQVSELLPVSFMVEQLSLFTWQGPRQYTVRPI